MVRLARLLLAGYGIAALAAAMAAASGADLIAVVALFWLCGAVTVALLAIAAAAVMPMRPSLDAEADREREDALLADALRQWEEDRLADRPPRRRADAG